MLTILIDNALKFTSPRSETLVTLERHGAEIVTSVADHGRGIAPDALEHLYERFYQAQMLQREPKSGLVLGLFIAKGIVEVLCGGIGVTSSVGVGTTFHFTLPLPSAPPLGEPARGSGMPPP